MTTLSGVISSPESRTADEQPDTGGALRLYIELARELASRLGIAVPSLPAERGTVGAVLTNTASATKTGPRDSNSGSNRSIVTTTAVR
jgi:hypothetical protein